MKTRHKRKIRWGRVFFVFVLPCVLLMIVLATKLMNTYLQFISYFPFAKHVTQTTNITYDFPQITETTYDSSRWNLILVNASHALPSDYEFRLMSLSNGEQIDERIYPDLQAMFDEARSQGIALYVRSGYRSTSEQVSIFNQTLADNIGKGYSYDEAVEITKQWVALPTTSEHETGLAIDINSEDDSISQQTAAWLYSNSYKYGFIRRYGEDKINITGIAHEPWHYRYVGIEVATYMFENNLSLEEYLGVA